MQGLPELRRKLERLKRGTEPKIKIAMEQAAGVITGTMRSLVPVDEGDLRSSIGWTWGDAPKGSISYSHSVGSMRLTIFAGDEKAFYARWIEFGTAPHNAAKGGGNKSFGGTGRAEIPHPGAPPQPFFYPAYRAHKKQVLAGMRKAIRSAVKEAVSA